MWLKESGCSAFSKGLSHGSQRTLSADVKCTEPAPRSRYASAAAKARSPSSPALSQNINGLLSSSATSAQKWAMPPTGHMLFKTNAGLLCKAVGPCQLSPKPPHEQRAGSQNGLRRSAAHLPEHSDKPQCLFPRVSHFLRPKRKTNPKNKAHLCGSAVCFSSRPCGLEGSRRPSRKPRHKGRRMAGSPAGSLAAGELGELCFEVLEGDHGALHHVLPMPHTVLLFGVWGRKTGRRTRMGKGLAVRNIIPVLGGGKPEKEVEPYK